MEEEQKKKSIIDWCSEHPKTVFATRAVLWAALAGGLPFAFIAWRYDIFTSTPKISLTGWGFIAIALAVAFISTLVRYIYKGLKPGLVKQCIFGLVTIILPLVTVLIVITAIENNIHIFKQALVCVIYCEAAAIPLNPFPAWLAERETEEGKKKAESMSELFWDKFFERKKDD